MSRQADPDGVLRKIAAGDSNKLAMAAAVKAVGEARHRIELASSLLDHPDAVIRLGARDMLKQAQTDHQAAQHALAGHIRPEPRVSVNKGAPARDTSDLAVRLRIALKKALGGRPLTPEMEASVRKLDSLTRGGPR